MGVFKKKGVPQLSFADHRKVMGEWLYGHAREAGLAEADAAYLRDRALKAFDQVLGESMALDVTKVAELIPAELRAALVPAITGSMVRLVLGKVWPAAMAEIVRRDMELIKLRKRVDSSRRPTTT